MLGSLRKTQTMMNLQMQLHRSCHARSAMQRMQLYTFASMQRVPPLARSQGPLAFVAMRMALDELASATSETAVELPPIVSRKLYEVVAVVAMQFRGYIFKVNEPQVWSRPCCIAPPWACLSDNHMPEAWLIPDRACSQACCSCA